jgi:hypothetical protein
MNHNNDIAHYLWLQCMTMTVTHGQFDLDNVGSVVHVFRCSMTNNHYFQLHNDYDYWCGDICGISLWHLMTSKWITCNKDHRWFSFEK